MARIRPSRAAGRPERHQPIAKPRPLPVGQRLTELPALCASLPHLSEAEATDFANDLAKAREELARAEAPDPWRS